MIKKKVRPPQSGDLRTSSAKLRGMSYLIELCGNLPATPLDEDQCFYGIGLIMKDIHDEILGFARSLEQWEIHRAQKKAANSKDDESRIDAGRTTR